MSARPEPLRFETTPWVPPAASRASRRARRPSVGAGRTTVIGPDRRKHVAESLLEGKVFLVTRVRSGVRALREQPAAMAYVDEAGVPRRHTFDCIVHFDDGRRIAALVKPRAVAERKGTGRLARLLASQLAEEVADGVILLTEEDAGPDAVHDAKLVVAARLHPRPEHDEVVRSHVRRHGGTTTIAEICRETGLRGAGLRAAARLIADGCLAKVSRGRIAPDTIVALGAQAPENAS